MSGPGACVYVPRLSDAEIDELEATINSLSAEGASVAYGGNAYLQICTTEPVRGNYAGPGQPFNVWLTRLLQNESTAQLTSAFRVPLEHGIGFSADCSGAENHRILGELCSWTAGRFGGIVSFDGLLLPRGAIEIIGIEADWGTAKPYHDELLARLHGKTLTRTYQTARETTWAVDYGDAEFMAAWLKHPHFHMIK